MTSPKDNKRRIIKKGYYILAGIFILYAAVGIIFLTGPRADIFSFFVRSFALFGFTNLSIAAVMSPFIKEVSNYFGRPFIKIHHIFAFTGLGLITAHPVMNAVQTGDISVFIPVFYCWIDCWIYAGRLALIFLYIGLLAILLRRKIGPWRILHMIVYLVLAMAYIHALLIGTDLYNTWMIIIFTVLMFMVLVSFVLKRIKLARRKS